MLGIGNHRQFPAEWRPGISTSVPPTRTTRKTTVVRISDCAIQIEKALIQVWHWQNCWWCFCLCRKWKTSNYTKHTFKPNIHKPKNVETVSLQWNSETVSLLFLFPFKLILIQPKPIKCIERAKNTWLVTIQNRGTRRKSVTTSPKIGITWLFRLINQYQSLTSGDWTTTLQHELLNE